MLSDGFDDLDKLASAIGHLRHRRHEVLFFQILAPRRRISRSASRRGSATSNALDHLLRIDPAALRTSYLEKFQSHCRGLKEKARSMNADYHKVSTAAPPERALLDYLAARSSHKRGGR